MWLSFFGTVLVTVLALYVPGYFLMGGLGAPCLVALCTAPLGSILGYVLLGFVYQRAGIFCTGINVLAPVLCLYVIVYLVRWAYGNRRKKKNGDKPSTWDYLEVPRRWNYLLAYVLFGFGVGLFVFVYNLDTPYSIIQNYDNGFHLDALRALADSGKWTCFGISQYMTPADVAIQPLPGGSSFYPAGWHIFGALIMSLTHTTPALTENVLNFVFSSIAWPASMFLFLETLFKKHPRVVLGGAIITMCSAIFPWGFITFGPLYPNLAGYAIVPSLAALFVLSCEKLFCKKKLTVCERIPWRGLALFLVGVCAVTLLHPNAVLLAVVLLAPYLVYKAAHIHYAGRFTTRCWVDGALTAVFVLFVWSLLYVSPIGATALTDQWKSFSTESQALKDILLLSPTEYPPHLGLVFLLVCGVVYAIRHSNYIWLIVSYGLVCVQYFVGATTDGSIKAFLDGFWYSDSKRIAAGIIMATVPLAAMGIAQCCIWVSGTKKQADHLRHGNVIGFNARALMCVIIIAVVCYAPSFSLQNSFSIDTPTGDAVNKINEENTLALPTRMYSYDEQKFVKEVQEIIPSDSLVINVPDDGSAFAYGADGLRVYYRNFRTYANGSKPQPGEPPKETLDSQLIRQHLDEVSTNRQVQQAVQNIGAEYLMVLDQGDMDNQDHLMTYDPVLWTGITDINENTPGFKMILGEGDMRLYQIEAVTR